MFSLAPRLLTLATALVLVLPPGSCQVLTAAFGEQLIAQSPASCCAHHTGHSAHARHAVPASNAEHAPGEELPAAPRPGSLDCCCDRDLLDRSTRSTVELPPTGTSFFAFALNADFAARPAAAFSPETPPSPRLHAILCCWRC